MAASNATCGSAKSTRPALILHHPHHLASPASYHDRSSTRYDLSLSLSLASSPSSSLACSSSHSFARARAHTNTGAVPGAAPGRLPLTRSAHIIRPPRPALSITDSSTGHSRICTHHPPTPPRPRLVSRPQHNHALQDHLASLRPSG